MYLYLCRCCYRLYGKILLLIIFDLASIKRIKTLLNKKKHETVRKLCKLIDIINKKICYLCI